MTPLALDEQTIDAIARRVAELLRPAAGEYLSADEYAIRFGVALSTVYAHADQLGAVRIGGALRLPATPPAPSADPPAAARQPAPAGRAKPRTARRGRQRVELLPAARPANQTARES